MTWSAVRSHDGYASDIEQFDTKDDAIAYINEQCDDQSWDLVHGTQMWNEPVGQIEEDDDSDHTVWFEHESIRQMKRTACRAPKRTRKAR
jgi:hypothetical protein